MHSTEREQGLRQLATTLSTIDRDVYAEYGRDPLEPILGGGAPDLRLAFFGRDPGRHEVEHGVPFIGAGGQKVRRVLHRRLRGTPPPDFEASRSVGDQVFWANTVPYKPLRNKAWGKRVQRAFHPWIADLLVHGWDGRDVVTLGRLAFFWFGLTDRAVHQYLDAHWKHDARFREPLDVPLVAPDGTEKTIRLHALPHPSPLNATWASRFPDMLDELLIRIELGPDTWRLPTRQTR